MDFGIIAGDTDQTIYVRLRDSTTGLAKTGLVFNSAGAACYYTLPGAAAVQITLATQTVNGAHSDGGFVLVSDTNAKGLYRLDLPDAAIASGKYSIISIEFDGIIEESVIVPLSLRKADLRQWLGTAAATPTVAGVPEVDVTHVGGDAQSATDLKDFADAGYDPATNKVQGVVLADTVTTLTNLPAITANWLTAAGIADDAFTAAKFATDAFTSDVLAASFVTEMQAGLSTHSAADVWAVATRLLTAGTNIVLAKGTGVTGFNDLSAAQVNTEVDTALADVRLDELLAADSDIDGAAPPTVGSVFHELMSKTAGSFTFDQTTDSLEALRDNTGTAGAGLTAIDLPDQTFNLTGNITGNISGSVGSVTAAITLPTIPVDWITSSGLAASAVTEIQSGLSTLDAAGVRTAVGLASANLDTQLDTLPTANENADALLDRANGIETGYTLRQTMRAIAAKAAGLISGAGTGTEVIKALGAASGGTTRLTATVSAAGDISAWTLNL